MLRRLTSTSPRTRTALLAHGGLLVIAALWVALPLGTDAAPKSPDELSREIERANAREDRLSAESESLNTVMAKLDRDVALLSGRVAAVEHDLARERGELDRLTESLARERTRARRLGKRLRKGRRVLARRLVERYQVPAPDLVTVVLSSRGFTELLERQEFLRRISDQDTDIVTRVRNERAAARAAAKRFGRLRTKQERITAGVRERRDGLAAIQRRLAEKRAQAASLRAARQAAIANTRGARDKLEKELAKVQRSEDAGRSYNGGNGNWAIPWAIVECESGGRNWPPNYAGASGYYQIIPSTWSGFGGKGPAAYLASKAEQDRVATLIWNNGAGARNWDCAYIVGIL